MLKVRRFHAPWCAPCKALAPLLDEVAGEMNIEVESLDAVQLGPDLAKYGTITGVPTLQLVQDDQVIKTVTGMQTRDQLKAFLTV